MFLRNKLVNAKEEKRERESNKYQKAVILKKLLVVAMEPIEAAANKY